MSPDQWAAVMLLALALLTLSVTPKSTLRRQWAALTRRSA